MVVWFWRRLWLFARAVDEGDRDRPWFAADIETGAALLPFCVAPGAWG